MNKNDINVKVEIKLSSGSMVTLTEKQQERVEAAVYGIIFKEEKIVSNDEPRIKRLYKRKRKVKRWSKEEEQVLADMLGIYPNGHEMHMAGIRSVASRLGRSVKVVTAKAYRLEHPPKEQGLLD